MRIVVTGSSGLLGSAIARQLRSSHSVLGIDALPGRETDAVRDIRDRREVTRAVRGADAVIHTAALHAPHVDEADDSSFWETNVEGTQNLLDAAGPSLSRFVFTSSTSVYGRALCQDAAAAWIDESVVPIPRDIYDITKLEAESRVAAAATAQRACTTLRISRCYPEPARSMALFRLYRGVDRRDVAQAHQLALESKMGGAQTYVISASTPFRKSDLRNLHHAAGEVLLRYHPDAEQQFKSRGWELPTTIDRVYSPARAVAELDYRPRYGFKQVLAGDTDPAPLPS